MSRIYTQTEVVARIPGLTGARLLHFVEAEIVLPIERVPEPGFQGIDLARLALACELADQFDLNEDALKLVLSLVDQLHAKRAELRVLQRALQAQPDNTRRQIGEALQAALKR